jgi:hypothetical protein
MVLNANPAVIQSTRRVVLLNDPYTNPANNLLWTTGQDNRGFQYQIALDALPAGVTIDMVSQGQVWFVENTSTAYRLSFYVGQISVSTIQGVTVSGQPTSPGQTLVSTSISGAIWSSIGSYVQSYLTNITANTVMVSGILSPGTWLINYKALLNCTIQPTIYTAASGSSTVAFASTVSYSSVAGQYQAQGYHILVVSGTGTQLNLNSYAFNGSNVTVSGLANTSNASYSALGNQTGFTAVRIA